MTMQTQQPQSEPWVLFLSPALSSRFSELSNHTGLFLSKAIFFLIDIFSDDLGRALSSMLLFLLVQLALFYLGRQVY